MDTGNKGANTDTDVSDMMYEPMLIGGKHSAARAMFRVTHGETQTAHSPRQNRILAALPAADYERLVPHLEIVEMELGWTLYESGDQQQYVFFPTSGIVSLLCVTEDAHSAEIAVIGNEGVVGSSLLMDDGRSTNSAVVKSAGRGYRMRANVFKSEFGRCNSLRNQLLLYAQALITQVAQTVVCNRHHTVDQQLCKWLLLSIDHLPSNELTMTHELIANMLGVRRESVTSAAVRLQEAGLIHYQHGKITVLDRPRLEKRACECYAVVKSEFDRLLPSVSALNS